MIKLKSESVVQCICTLSPKDEQKIFDFVKEYEIKDLEDAVKELWLRGEIEIYWNSSEIDWATEKIYDIEFVKD